MTRYWAGPEGDALPAGDLVRSALPSEEPWTVLQGRRIGCYTLALEGRAVGEVYTRSVYGRTNEGWSAYLYGGAAIVNAVDWGVALCLLLDLKT